MVSVVTPPLNKYEHNCDVRVFLAGTIDDGNSYDWQKEVITYLNIAHKYEDIVVANPRRDNWGKLEQSSRQEQILWELDHLSKADIIFLNFLKDSKSPISLLEFGMLCNNLLNRSGQRLIIVCPKEFYRYENVRTTVEWYCQQDPLLQNWIKLYNTVQPAYFGLSETIRNLT